MSAAFLYRDVMVSAAFIGDLGTVASPSLPLGNLTDSQPRIRTRWTPASASIYVDFGASQTVSALALIGTNLTAASTVRWRIGNDAGFSATNYDTGDLYALTTAAAGGNVVLLHATSASGRYMRVDLADLVLGWIDVGRLVAGPLFRTTHAWAYGAGEGRLMLDRRDRNGFTGAEFPVPAVVNPRVMHFTLGAITQAEAVGDFRTMQDTLGAAGDALWIPDDGLSLAELNQRSIWGAVAQPGESALITRSNFRLHSRSFQMVERV